MKNTEIPISKHGIGQLDYTHLPRFIGITWRKFSIECLILKAFIASTARALTILCNSLKLSLVNQFIWFTDWRLS